MVQKVKHKYGNRKIVDSGLSFFIALDNKIE